MTGMQLSDVLKLTYPQLSAILRFSSSMGESDTEKKTKNYVQYDHKTWLKVHKDYWDKQNGPR